MIETMQNYQKVYQMLEDNESRDIYLRRLNYLISGDFQHIEAIAKLYLPDLMRLQDKMMAELILSMPKDKGIVLYGAGDSGAEILKYFANDKRLVGFCSRTEKKQKDGYLGYPVMSPKELLARKDLSVVVSVGKSSLKYEIREILESGGYPSNLIFYISEYYNIQESQQYFGPDFITYDNDEVFIDAGCLDLGTSLIL